MTKVSWQAAGRGVATGVAWSDWLDGCRHVDPYLVWADLTSFAGLGGLQPGDMMAVLLEAAKPPVFSGDTMPLVFAEIEVPRVYRPEAEGEASRRLFFTARIRPESVLTLLSSCDEILRFQLGLPRVPFTDPGGVPSIDTQAVAGYHYPKVVMGVVDDGCAFSHPQFIADGSEGNVLLRTGSSRVRYLWDQGTHERPAASATPSPLGSTSPTKAGNLGYGVEWGPDEIDRLMTPGPSQDSNQRHVYDAAGYRRMKWQRPLHGTGVLDLACGSTPPLDPAQAAHPWSTARAPGSPPAPQRPLDMAARSPAVFVQMPVTSVLDTSGGSLGVHLLDGVMYVVARAQSLGMDQTLAAVAGATPTRFASTVAVAPHDEPATEAGSAATQIGVYPRIVVTASFGSIAGPHDGTSMIEMALAELARTQPGLALVVAAGNAHGSRTHAALGLEAAPDVAPQPANVAKGQRALSALAPGTWREVDWEIAPDNPHESYLEIWIEDDCAEGILVSLQPPLGAPPVQAQVGDALLLRAQSPGAVSDVPMAGVIFAKRVAQGLCGTMVLLAVGPTMPTHRMPVPSDLDRTRDTDPDPRPPVPRPPAPSGAWRVTVENKLGRRVSVHLWTERNDLVGRQRRRQQSRLQDVGPPSVQSDHSLGTLANGSPECAKGQVWVVGGYRLSDGRMAAYSSGGPSRAPSTRTGPDVEAPSDMAPSMPGLRVAGASAGAHSRLGGTSAAAPLLARWIANHWTGRDPASLAALIENRLPKPVPDRVADTPPWPEPMPQGTDDLPRRGRRRL